MTNERETRTRRNPSWTVDELIIALDLYLRLDFGHNGGRYSHRSPEILETSQLLNSLPHPAYVNGVFRNPAGVYVKLSNFLRLDPAYPGKGLDAGNKLDAVVWQRFANKTEELAELASAILRNAKEAGAPVRELDTEEEIEAGEGQVLLTVHRKRERSSKLREAKIRSALNASGRLACEACGMTFEEVYGELGRGFIEVHHLTPLARLEPGVRTRLSDLALICSNCHRMAHKGSITLGDLRSSIQRRP